MPYNSLTYKIASEPWEFEQIHRLNYRTFVEEIPQHASNAEQRLVDKFHDENTYFICLSGRRLAGMMAARANRPFSLDEKITDLDSYLPAGASACEIRLLALEPEFRQSGVFADLFRFVAEECLRRGYTLAIASGTVRQQHLYSTMGFIPFAQPIGTEQARYQPMYLTLQSVQELFKRLGVPKPALISPLISFLPGPVEIDSKVREAFTSAPISHRSDAFLAMVAETKQLLCDLTGASGVELLLGSGTLGNEVVAAKLRLQEGRGLVLSNGEFGERLIDHADRQELSFEVLRAPWGSRYDMAALELLLAERKDITWLWSTHCETSSGVLNDLEGLEAICRRHGVRLCMDCTSSLGTVPVDLRGVYLATSVSGKGLASFPGIALVFYNHNVISDRRLPRYLDLGYYREKQGVPFTHSSNLVAALHQALIGHNAESRFDTIRRRYSWLRGQLEESGFRIMVAEGHASPAVISIVLSSALSSQRLGEELEKLGFLLSFRSSYLIERNIVQICLMGVVAEDDCLRLLKVLLEVVGLFKHDSLRTMN
jgi:aspartate aminotransferase-like enzyme/GNAT superfamily N-acetyltransferase